MSKLTHLDKRGRPRMVDVTEKDKTLRIAVAESTVILPLAAARSLEKAKKKKGDPFSVALLAGIQAAKKTPDLIPLCHPIRIESVNVDVVRKKRSVTFTVTCVTTDRTGIEMEAMVGASVAALAFYDMVKSLDHGIVIDTVRLLKKSGGRSGTYSAAKKTPVKRKVAKRKTTKRRNK